MMNILTSKWTMLLLLLIMLALIVLYLIGKKSVHHEITVDASPDKVWSILSDIKNYPEWNQVITYKEGELAEGSKLILHFTQDADTAYDVPVTVKAMIPQKLLNQAGGISGVMTYNHRYELEPDNASTKVTIHEDYRGIYVPFWNPAPVEAAYGRLNQALKERAEMQ